VAWEQVNDFQSVACRHEVKLSLEESLARLTIKLFSSYFTLTQRVRDDASKGEITNFQTRPFRISLFGFRILSLRPSAVRNARKELQ
jgi:hypothetical protein